jgi:pSer/pThr/pTyr-binding forkhead associated (FHA) protein
VPTSLLQVLNDCLLLLMLLFFFRVLRAVWVQVNPPALVPVASAGPAAARPAASSSKGLRLRILEPEPLRGQAFDLSDEVTLGRSQGCGVYIADTAVSQLHARLFRQNNTLWIEDLGSTNGTWVNRTKVTAPVALKRGDRVAVGGTILEVTK